MHGYFTVSLILLSAASVFGDPNFHHEMVKQLLSTSSKKIIPLNAASCSDLTNDIDKKCNSNITNCNDAQKYVDCAVDYVKSNCGCSAVDFFCDQYNQANLPCSVKCNSNNVCGNSGQKCKTDGSCNSASSLVAVSCVGAILLCKMFFEKIVFAF